MSIGGCRTTLILVTVLYGGMIALIALYMLHKILLIVFLTAFGIIVALIIIGGVLLWREAGRQEIS